MSDLHLLPDQGDDIAHGIAQWSARQSWRFAVDDERRARTEAYDRYRRRQRLAVGISIAVWVIAAVAFALAVMS